jgi:flagellar basal-body rod protein FlgG
MVPMHDIQLTASAMNHRIQQQEIIAKNLANVNTVGFKRDKIFQEILSDSSPLSEAELKEVIIFEQVNLKETHNPLDFGLSGEGFFSIQTSDGQYYSRNGSFGLNPAGLLSLEDGLVMGHNGPIEIRGKVTVNEQGDIFVNGQYDCSPACF